MKREKYIEDYEDFEPEMRTWPFLLLSFLMPLIPLSLNIFLGMGFTWVTALEYAVSLLPLFCTALCIKDGERAWTLIVSSALYWLSVLLEWALSKLGGNTELPLGLPFILALMPGLLPLEAYTFFAKRKRSNWIGWALVSFIFSLCVALVMWNKSGGSLLWTSYPMVMVLLSFLLFFVTRRTESTPWYITVALVLLTLSSFTLYPDAVGTLSADSGKEKINVLFRCFLFYFPFWYTLSFLFVFSGLAGKSSYRTTIVDDEEEYTGQAGNYDDMSETVVVPPSPQRENAGYTNPPEYSRYDNKSSVRPEESQSGRSEAVPPASERPAARQASPVDDKWYDFIEGGVRSDERDDRDMYRDDRRTGYDERRERYDDRDRERFYRDERRSDYDGRDYRSGLDRDYSPRRYDDDSRYSGRDRERYYRDERRSDYDERDYRRGLDRDYPPRRYDDDSRYSDRDRR